MKQILWGILAPALVALIAVAVRHAMTEDAGVAMQIAGEKGPLPEHVCRTASKLADVLRCHPCWLPPEQQSPAVAKMCKDRDR
jgi:hypothetical protein